VLNHVGLRVVLCGVNGGGVSAEFVSRECSAASIFDLSEYIGVLYADIGVLDADGGLFGKSTSATVLRYLEVPYTDVHLSTSLEW